MGGTGGGVQQCHGKGFKSGDGESCVRGESSFRVKKSLENSEGDKEEQVRGGQKGKSGPFYPIQALSHRARGELLMEAKEKVDVASKDQFVQGKKVFGGSPATQRIVTPKTPPRKKQHGSLAPRSKKALYQRIS